MTCDFCDNAMLYRDTLKCCITNDEVYVKEERNHYKIENYIKYCKESKLNGEWIYELAYKSDIVYLLPEDVK